MNDKEILGLEEKRFAAMIERDFGKLESMVVVWQSTPLQA